MYCLGHMNAANILVYITKKTAGGNKGGGKKTTGWAPTVKGCGGY